MSELISERTEQMLLSQKSQLRKDPDFSSTQVHFTPKPLLSLTRKDLTTNKISNANK